MATKIEWTDETWNPIRAKRKDNGATGCICVKVSSGCAICYAETHGMRGLPGGGLRLPYQKSSLDQVELYLDEKKLMAPLRRKKPTRYFVCSMTDLFGEWVPREFIVQAYGVMQKAWWHTYQVLTKRPERAAEITNDPAFHSDVLKAAQSFRWPRWAMDLVNRTGHMSNGWPFSNIWLGTSVENQETADERIPHLLKCPAAVRWLSMEPLLGAVDLAKPLGASIYFCISRRPSRTHVAGRLGTALGRGRRRVGSQGEAV